MAEEFSFRAFDFPYRLPTGVMFAAQKFVKADERSQIRQHEIKRNRQNADVFPRSFQQPADESRQIKKRFARAKISAKKIDENAKNAESKQNQNQKKRHGVAQNFVRNKFDGEKSAVQRIQHFAVAPKSVKV